MKKGIIIFILFVAVVGLFFFVRSGAKEEKALEILTPTAGEVTHYKQMEKAPIEWTDVQTTDELAGLFKDVRYDRVPRLFVRQFPSDFAQKGNPALFAMVLLPHLLQQNELVLVERAAYLALADKLKNGDKLNDEEEAFWNDLVLKYEVLNPDKNGQMETLFRRIERVSPSLAIAQGLEATNDAKQDLDSPFDVRRWNEQKQYDYVKYPDLASAVADYALELNRGYSYLKFHIMRSARMESKKPLKGSDFLRALEYYKIEDADYIQKLRAIFDWYGFQVLDEAKFIKEN